MKRFPDDQFGVITGPARSAGSQVRVPDAVQRACEAQSDALLIRDL
jgi:hypothetical protein